MALMLVKLCYWYFICGLYYEQHDIYNVTVILKNGRTMPEASKRRLTIKTPDNLQNASVYIKDYLNFFTIDKQFCLGPQIARCFPSLVSSKY